MLQVLAGWCLGVLLGMRHALEPDHLTAVTTLVAEERSARKAALIGMTWGAGHTISLLVVAVVLAAMQSAMPGRLAETFEFAVALMLVGLGVRSIRHAHAGGTPHAHWLPWSRSTRPLLVGAVHGLAGSGSLTALAVATLPSGTSRVVSIAVFGIGSASGMALLSGLAGWPLARLAKRPAALRRVQIAAGSVSAMLGFVWAYPFLARWLAA